MSRKESAIGLLPELTKALTDNMERASKPPFPYMVTGVDRSYAAGRGCEHKDGEIACGKTHLCLTSECDGKPHGWAHCDALDSLFHAGKGTVPTIVAQRSVQARSKKSPTYGGGFTKWNGQKSRFKNYNKKDRNKRRNGRDRNNRRKGR